MDLQGLVMSLLFCLGSRSFDVTQERLAHGWKWTLPVLSQWQALAHWRDWTSKGRIDAMKMHTCWHVELLWRLTQDISIDISIDSMDILWIIYGSFSKMSCFCLEGWFFWGLKSARKPIPKIPVPKLPPLRSWGFQPSRSIETVSRSPAAQAARLVASRCNGSQLWSHQLGENEVLKALILG